MGKTLYLECSSGVSGDMLVASLLDLGASREALMDALRSLPEQDFDVSIERVQRSGIDCCAFSATYEEPEPPAADEDGKSDKPRKGKRGKGKKSKEADAAADAPASQSGETGRWYVGRSLDEILSVIEGAQLDERARAIATRTFEILAQAGTKAHGVPTAQVRLYETGSIEAIVEVVAAAACLVDLDVTDVVVTELCDGGGTIHCTQGVLPVPVPAVTAIAIEHNLPLRLVPVHGELVTPTGAALVAATRTSGKLPERFAVRGMGIGAGSRELAGSTGIVRAMVVEESSAPLHDAVCQLECDIDDATGEMLGNVLEELMAAGAREAHCIPLFTKKNRPAYQLQVICGEEDVPRMERLVFEETTTIGVRRCRMERTVLPRTERAVWTELGEIAVKSVILPSGETRLYPEHDSVAQAARDRGVSYQQAYRCCLAACTRSERKA